MCIVSGHRNGGDEKRFKMKIHVHVHVQCMIGDGGDMLRYTCIGV